MAGVAPEPGTHARAAPSFADPGEAEGRPAAPPRGSEDAWRPSVLLQALLMCMALYFGPAAALFQQYYKEVQRLSGGEQCEELWAKVVEGLEGAPQTEPTSSVIFEGLEKLKKEESAPIFKEELSVTTGRRLLEDASPKPRGSGAWEAALAGFWGAEMVRVSNATAGPGGVYFDEALQRPACSWYLVEVARAPRHRFLWRDRERQHCGGASREECEARPGCRHAEEAPAGEQGPGCFFKDCAPGDGRTCYVREIHSYDKGVALFAQSVVAAFVHWAWAFAVGGTGLLRSCFHFSKMRRFAAVGCLLGFSSVFGFLAQAKLTPGSYVIVGQSTIIVVPVMWCIALRTPIPAQSWLYISMTAFGMYMYSWADMEEADDQDTLLGIGFALIKVGLSAIAAVHTERRLKTLCDVPFPVQVSYILPFKALACLATSFILPPHRYPPPEYRPGWALHDMSLAVVLVLFHSLGDAILSGAVVHVFDSVAKAFIVVGGIIFPTWVVSSWLGWDTIEWSTRQGKLKAAGAVIVIAMAFAYIMERAQARELSTRREAVAEMQRRHPHLSAGPASSASPPRERRRPPTLAPGAVSAKKAEVMTPPAALAVGMPAMVWEGRWKPDGDGKWRPQPLSAQGQAEEASESVELAEARPVVDEDAA